MTRYFTRTHFVFVWALRKKTILDRYVTVSITILKVLNWKLEQLAKALLRKISKPVFRMGAGVKQETLRVVAALDWSDR
jgi:hypothetical protein